MNYQRKAKSYNQALSPFLKNKLHRLHDYRFKESDRLMIESIRTKLKLDNTVLKITDHGVGSKKLGNERTVRSIFKVSSSNGRYGELLTALTHSNEAKSILEFGTSLGIGTNYLAFGAPKSTITTIEGCPETLGYANHFLPKNTNAQCSSFNSFLEKLSDEKFDFVFLDGHHDGHATRDYFNSLKPYLTENACIVFDDIRWSEDMLHAWEEIIKQDGIKASVDCFRMGIVWLGESKSDEHFVLRF